MKFTELNKTLKTSLDPVYLLEGEEAYFSDHAKEQILCACKIAYPALNLVSYEGEAFLKDPTLFDRLYTLPMFDEKRAVVLSEYYPSEKEFEAHLKPYLDAPSPSCVLLIVNKKKGAFDLKRRGATYVDCSRADEETLSRWLFRLFEKLSLKAEPEACELVVRYCAQNAARIRLEAEKLKLLLKEGELVDRTIVEEHIEKDAEYKIYELTQAASRGNFAQFSSILFDLLEKGSDELSLLSALTAHFKTLCYLSRLKCGDEEAAKLLSMKPYAVKKNREILRGGKNFEPLFQKLYALGCLSREGKVQKRGALLCAIDEIFFQNPEKGKEMSENPLQKF